MSTVSTPTTGSFPKSKRSFGSMFGAVVLTVAVGAGIAAGIAIVDNGPAQVTESIYTERLEALLNENLNPPQLDRADQVHQGRGADASERAMLRAWANQGLIPEQALQGAKN